MPWGPEHFLEEVRRQLQVYDAMFEDVGLRHLRARTPDHPAVVRYDLLQRLVSTARQQEPWNEEVVLPELASAWMDRLTWAHDEDPAAYWEQFSDQAGVKFIRDRIPHSNLYPDVIEEVFWWGWLRNVCEVKLQQVDGQPDLHLATPQGEAWAEVKRLRPASRPLGIKRAIYKADRQIKRADPSHSGVVFVHIPRTGGRASLNHVGVPADVRPFADQAQRLMRSTYNTHVGQVVLTWDEFRVTSKVGYGSLYAFARRALLIEHEHPLSPPVLAEPLAKFGITVLIEWLTTQRTHPATTVLVGGLQVTARFIDMHEMPHNLHRTQAVEVVLAPDDCVTYTFGDAVFGLFSKIDETWPSPCIVIIETIQLGARPAEIVHGFRLVASAEEISDLRMDADRALCVLVARYGLPIRVGADEGLLLPDVRVPALQPLQIDYFPQTGRRGFMHAIMDAPDLTDGTRHIRWAFALDLERYEGSLGKAASDTTDRD
jgi:hypothetical protein